MKKFTTEEFIIRAKQIHGNKYNYSKVNYKSALEKIIIICSIHGEFLQIPASHLRGYNCTLCHSKRLFTVDEFIFKANKIHNDKYNYSNTIYLGYKTKVNIICPLHGNFQQRADDHLGGHGCFECGKKSKGEEYIKKCLDKNNIEYIREFKIEELDNLRFDFYLYEKDIFIEYDGIQHFKPTFSKEEFIKTQINDNLKNEYCLKNNIKIIRIPYLENTQEKVNIYLKSQLS